MIGYVYLVEGGGQRYVLKLYRPFDSDKALRSTGILQYLRQQDYPAAVIVPTRAGGSHVRIETPRGSSVAILFDYLDGQTPDLDREMAALARQVGRLHRLMETYPQPLPRRGQEFYIDRCISILHALDYPARRIAELAEYGRDCWARISRLPAGFCHGDLHTGNMLQTSPGRYTLFDFDIASRTHPLIDVATLCDDSNFNHFDPTAYQRTQRVFERFYQGYRQERELNDAEIAAIFDFIPVRHYEIIATITQCQGLEELSWPFLDQQYDWLLHWRELCERKGQV